jgi:putative ABC transport system ATP-binding protein
MPQSLLEFRDVWKSYPRAGGEPLHALRGISMTVPAGRSVAIIGRSGSGKSTLLHLAAGIDSPTQGSIYYQGRDRAEDTDRERTLFRRDQVGLVFQFFHLLPHLNVIDNVVLPAMIAGEARGDSRDRAADLLKRVGLASRQKDAVEKLSGGEMQRVAIFRALIRNPRLLLADEPTGNLDDDTGRKVMDLMLELFREQGSSLVYVTHSHRLAARADETWVISSGEMADDVTSAPAAPRE